MDNKKKLQILFTGTLILGFLLMLFWYTRFYGCFLLCVLMPVLGLYYIAQVAKTESTDPVKLAFRYPLLLTLKITFIVLLIKMFFMIMHWPFAGPMNAFIYGVSIIALMMGIVFIILNRKIIQSVFVMEITLLLLPVFFMLTFVMPANYSGSEYREAMQNQYENLTEIKHVLYQQVKKDTLNDLKQVDLIEQTKDYVIKVNGGFNGDGTIYRGMSKIWNEEIERYMNRMENDSIAYRIMRQHPENVVGFVNALTKVQIDLLLKEKNN